jgi:ATP-dependent DNA helicase RecQ
LGIWVFGYLPTLFALDFTLPACNRFAPVKADSADLLAPLKQVFGFSSFRPLQEEIIRDSLAGRDVLAILPTGGGKSLCFQLPALV